MITATNRSLSRNLVLAGLALFGTVASFSATVSPAQAAGQRYTAKLKKEFECRCGALTCRGTMLAPKK